MQININKNSNFDIFNIITFLSIFRNNDYYSLQYFLFSVCRNSNVSGEKSPFEGSCCSGQDASSDSDVEESISKYRVVLLGDSGVGKTALVSQFMTSEYMNTYDASLGKSVHPRTINNAVTPFNKTCGELRLFSIKRIDYFTSLV